MAFSMLSMDLQTNGRVPGSVPQNQQLSSLALWNPGI